MKPPAAFLPAPQAAGPGAKPYAVGTLRYNQKELVVLFLWLMWNDFSIMLIEQVSSLNNVLFQNHGATYTEIAAFTGAGGLATILINPWISTWSDRVRTTWGRRRPFLFAAAPLFALSLVAIPFMPDLYDRIAGSSFRVVFSHLPMNGAVFLIGMASFISGLFNAGLLAIFSYLYWDVVPERVMGRFSSLSKIVTALAGLLWSLCFMGLAEHHMKGVFLGVSLFCLIVYLVSVWKIQEGEYPPPDIHQSGGVIAPIRAYLVECFGQSYYLWIFAGFTFYQIGNIGNQYQFFYQLDDLKMDLGTIGQMKAVGFIVPIIFGYAIGSLVDRLKPVRLLGPALFLWSLTNFLAFFLVTDKWSLLVCSTLTAIAMMAYGILYAAFVSEMFPLQKLGQFCSANTIAQQLATNGLIVFVGMLFDHIHYNRLGYLWSATFEMLASIIFVKVYYNWKAHGQRSPVPYAG